MTQRTETFESGICLPDLWQRDTLQHLRQGFDVIVDAPTGAGKTFIFEQWVETGYATILPGRPRLADARPVQLRPSERLDWPACLQCLALAPPDGNHYEELRRFSRHLFFEQAVPPPLSLPERKRLIPPVKESGSPSTTPGGKDTVTRMLHSDGSWERPGPKVRAPLGKTLRRNR